MGKRGGEKAADEVEQLLRAAEDELLLNLSTNTHTISNPNPNPNPNPNALDPDLARRFDALKRKPAVQPHPDDLAARLAALKGVAGTSGDDGGLCRGGGDEGESVEDVMRWAMDVARLEPSSSVRSEDDDGEEEDGGGKRKMKEKKKGVVEEEVKDGKKKWYFF